MVSKERNALTNYVVPRGTFKLIIFRGNYQFNCFLWLLREHFVFKHSVSNSSSVSDHSASLRLSEELDSVTDQAPQVGENELLEDSRHAVVHSERWRLYFVHQPYNNLSEKNYEQRLHEINTLEWDELLVKTDISIAPEEGGKVSLDRQNLVAVNDSTIGGGKNLLVERSTFDKINSSIGSYIASSLGSPNSTYISTAVSQLSSNAQKVNFITTTSNHSLGIGVHEGWINDIISDSPGSVDDSAFESSILPSYEEFTTSAINHHQSSIPEQIFDITDISPGWAYKTERTKILVTGFFHDQFAHLAKSSLFCVCGDVCIPTEVVQLGVYRSVVPPHPPGFANLYLSLDGQKPISQVLNFEFHSKLLDGSGVSLEEKDHWEEFQVQMRLLGLLFSTSKSLSILSSKASPTSLKVAKNFAQKIYNVANGWDYSYKSIQDNKISLPSAKDGLLEVILKNSVREWLLERIVEGSKKSKDFDAQGQGVIHLCAILGYAWAVQLFVWSGLTLDFRDIWMDSSSLGSILRQSKLSRFILNKGREKMVAVLLYAGAKPNLVTDPTPENPGGCIAVDLAASFKGHVGLAAYLSEKALVSHFREMSIARNISGTLGTSTTENESVNSENLREEQLYMNDSLAAYTTAADAAARIQAAFREHKQRSKVVRISNPENEACNIIAAMKIQHAFRNHEMRRKMAAAAHIQHRFRTWKLRKDFLNARRQDIKIQAAFRGFQVRRQYRKIIWSVGVLEKAILRWRLKRKGFRGLQVEPVESLAQQTHESDTEENFYRTSQKLASERVGRSVVRVQALFRSKESTRKLPEDEDCPSGSQGKLITHRSYKC